jgi:hypothetical protein
MSGEISESAAPASTHDIAAAAIETAEAQASSASETAPAAETTATVPETTAAPVVDLSEAAKFLQTKGHRAKTQDGRDTWLKFNTVEKFLDDYVSHHRGSWDTRYTDLEKRAKALEAEQQEYLQAIRGDETAFLTELAKVDPRYARFLQAQTAAAAETGTGDPKPEPDLDLGNGAKTYSVQQHEKLAEWIARRLIDERLKPIEERDKAARERAAQAQAVEQVRTRAVSQIEAAKQWPNWAEYEADVLKALQADSEAAQAESRPPRMTLREAYLEVHAKYLAADDTTKRQRLIDEANKAAKSTAVTKGGVESTRPAAPRSTADIARATIAQLEGAQRS